MTLRLMSRLRRFRRNENGSAPVIEFVIMVPLLFALLLSSFELSLFSFRQNWLDRGLDLAVRDIRLNTGANYTHAQVKQMICGYAGFLDQCEDHIKLEMTPTDPRSFGPFDGSADCVDVQAPLAPSRVFVHGSEHDLMILRACYLYEPVFPRIGMGEAMTSEGNQYYPLISVSVFVQEPGA